MQTVEHYVRVGDQHIPVIAFFGTKGGVGKTTIVNKFSTLVARAPKRPNVLMVDFDVHHRGLTVLRTGDSFKGCRTIHEYLFDEELEFKGAQDVTPSGSFDGQGREYLIPSSNLAAEKVFESLTRVEPRVLVGRLAELLNKAAKEYNISLILIDCGPIVDPLTASAAFMSEDAFIIGQNEPITFRSLQSYPTRIHEFLPEFNASNVRVILNKVRGNISQKTGIYAVIPFTMEVVDFSEGLTNIDEVRLIYLDHCIRELIKSIFKERYEELIPEPQGVLTNGQRNAIEKIDYYPQTDWYRRRKKGALLLYVGVGLLLVSIVILGLSKFSDSEHSLLESVRTYLIPILVVAGIVLAAVGARFCWLLHQANSIIRVKQRTDYEGLLQLLTTKQGRRKFNQVRELSEKEA